MELTIHGTRLVLKEGDITGEDTDIIVNAANSSLMGGGGVDGAIHRAGGETILHACKEICAARGPLPTGQAVITTGGRLKARFVIHTVGPIWTGGGDGEDRLLAACYRNSLCLAAEHGARRISFPSISTGAYGFPLDQAAGIAMAAVAACLKDQFQTSTAGTPFEQVCFVLFSPMDYEAYARALEGIA
jgi:O-acetyl-ADP-ribose deacetylase (regulator of RNase III)